MATYTIYHGASNPIKAVGVHQCNLLRFAEKHRGWHSIKKDKATLRAVKALQLKGCLEVVGDQFRFVYPEVKP